MQTVIESFISVLSFAAIVVFFNELWDILNFRVSEYKTISVLFGFALLGVGWFTVLLAFPQMQTKETNYPISELVVQEYSNGIEYKTKDRTLIYTIQSVEEYKNKDNIIGFIKVEKDGWGIDSTKIKPVYKVEQSN